MRIITLAALLFSFVIATPQLSVASTTSSEEVKNQPTPNPLELSTDWWSYFGSAGDKLDERIEQFLNNLQAMQEELSPEAIEAATPFVTKILIELDVFKTLEKSKYTPPVAYPFHDTYTIDQVILVAEELLKTNATLKQDKKERFQLNQHKVKLENHLDHISLQYFGSDEKSQKRMLLGLDMMATRLAIAIKDKLIYNTDNRLRFLTEKQTILRNELNHAFLNLDESGINTEKLNTQIKALQKELQVKQNESLRAELQALSHYGTSEKDQITTILLYQKAINSLLDDAIINTDIQTLKLITLLPQYNETLTAKEAEDLIAQLDQIEPTLREIDKSRLEWEEITNRDFELSPTIDSSTETEAIFDQLYEIQTSSIQKNSILHDKLFFALLLNNSLEDRFKPQQGPLSWGTWSIKDFLETVAEWAMVLHSYRLFKINELPVTVGSVFTAILVFIGILILSSLARRSLKRVAKRMKAFNESNVYVLDRLIHYATLLVATFFFLYALGFDPTNIFIILGGLSVGIGFGLQNIVNNFVCSIIILFHRMVKIGDFIELPDGEWGKVSDINFQNTLVSTWDGTDIIMPNSDLMSNKFVNWTLKNPFKRMHIPFGVAYGSDKDLVTKAVLEAADSVDATIKDHAIYPNPKVWLVNFEDSALAFELIVWVNFAAHSNVGSFTAAYKWAIESSLNKYGISIPFPQRDIHIKDK